MQVGSRVMVIAAGPFFGRTGRVSNPGVIHDWVVTLEPYGRIVIMQDHELVEVDEDD